MIMVIRAQWEDIDFHSKHMFLAHIDVLIKELISEDITCSDWTTARWIIQENGILSVRHEQGEQIQRRRKN